MQIQTGRDEPVERPGFQADLTVAVQKQMVERQAAERVVLYQLT